MKKIIFLRFLNYKNFRSEHSFSEKELLLKNYMTYEIQTPSASYRFTLWPIDTIFNRIAGIYIFLIIPPISEVTVAEVLEAQYSLLYAGITNNF